MLTGTTLWAAAHHAASQGLDPTDVYAIGGAVLVVGVVLAAVIGRRTGRRALSQRLTALGSRLGVGTPDETNNIETALSYLEQVTGAASEAVADSSADAIRLRRSLDTLPQGVVLCDENGSVVYRNARANSLMTSRHGDALAAQVVTELLEHAWDQGFAERTLDLYGPPRRTLAVRARLIDDGRRSLGVLAMIEDISERRRLEEIRRDFVANVSHELKTPVGALGLLAETLVAEPDTDVARRLAGRIQTEAFRVSRIIDDLLDLSRIESEEAPPREPVLVNLVMAEAVERVRATADQRGITITLAEPDPPVAVHGDRRQLVSAMHALIENAVTYSYDGSEVTVSGRTARAAVDGNGEPARPAASPAPPVAGIGPVASTIITASATAANPATTTPAVPAAEPAGPPVSAAVATSANPANPADGVNGANGPHGDGDGDGEGAGAGLSTTPNGAEPPSPGISAPIAAGAEDGPGNAAPLATRDTVRLTVVDRGVGIPARDLDRIFERFYRVDHGRSRDTGGTGLGLSIVRHVANNHQGWVEVESREGEGSSFTLVLPLQPDRLP